MRRAKPRRSPRSPSWLRRSRTNKPVCSPTSRTRVASDPTQIVFFEVYADEAAMKNHGQQPHLKKLGELFATGLFKPFAEGKPVDVVKLDRIAGFSR